MDVNKGAERTRKEHLLLVEAMQNKWGRYYGYNHKRNIALINVKR